MLLLCFVGAEALFTRAEGGRDASMAERICLPAGEAFQCSSRGKISLDKCRRFGYGKEGEGCGRREQTERLENQQGVRRGPSPWQCPNP